MLTKKTINKKTHLFKQIYFGMDAKKDIIKETSLFKQIYLGIDAKTQFMDLIIDQPCCGS